METIDHGNGIVTIQLNISNIVDKISMLIVNRALERIAALMPSAELIGSQAGAFNFSIEELYLTNRAIHCLRNAKIFTVDGLLRHSRADLLAIKNMGRRTVYEICEALGKYGLSLRQDSQNHLKPIPKEEMGE